MARSKFGKWDYIVIFLIFISGYLLYYTYQLRAEGGLATYYSDGNIIMLSTVAHVIFFALITGYVISKILSKVGK